MIQVRAAICMTPLPFISFDPSGTSKVEIHHVEEDYSVACVLTDSSRAKA